LIFRFILQFVGFLPDCYVMICPKCQNPDTQVIDSRPSSLGIRRRRLCKECGYRFTTMEELKVFDLYVEKRNGLTQLFSEKKLEIGIRKAFNKRTIDENKIKTLTQKVLQDIMALDQNPVKSTSIGQRVLTRLRETDEAAYICYWAMFGNFSTVDEFVKLIEEVKKD
jgi:transcriptional repressor NrdR